MFKPLAGICYRLGLAIAAVLLVAFAAACAEQEEEPAPAPTTAAAPGCPHGGSSGDGGPAVRPRLPPRRLRPRLPPRRLQRRWRARSTVARTQRTERIRTSFIPGTVRDLPSYHSPTQCSLSPVVRRLYPRIVPENAAGSHGHPASQARSATSCYRGQASGRSLR